jgi:hypothetical protein
MRRNQARRKVNNTQRAVTMQKGRLQCKKERQKIVRNTVSARWGVSRERAQEVGET